MPAHAPLSVVDRFDRLHGLSTAILRLFVSGDWTLEHGRAVEAELRSLLLTWTWSRPGNGDKGIAALLDALEAADLFDPTVLTDRGPFIERMLRVRDRLLLEAAAQPGRRQPDRASSRGEVQRCRDAGDALAHERERADAHEPTCDGCEAAHRHVAGISEALRAPSQTVLAVARLLAARPELSTLSRQYLRHVVDAGRRLLRVGGEALDLVRAEAGRLCWRIEPVALEELLGTLTGPGIDRAPVAVRVSILSDGRLVVRCDPMRLLQVLRALIADASHCSLVAVRVRGPGVGDPATGSGDRVEVRIVRDTPAGSGAEDRNDALRLAGLLLPIMGATIEVRTTAERPSGQVAGKGLATMILRLAAPSPPPVAIAPAPAHPGGTAEDAPADAPRRPTVLHIDDDGANLSLLQELFRDGSPGGDEPYVQVRPSPSAALGVVLAQSAGPDAVLLDVDSPAIDAFSVLRELKADPRTRDIPVIALIADVTESRLRRIDHCGFFRFIEKPLSIPELLRTIEDAFRIRRRTG